ncbi:AAA family ATPase [Legionella sp. 29fVS95]|uniref:AAA family ATPase n=2 Tax=Legionella sp. 29fVS95 TaxID=3402813 RepID=UPI003AF93868
MSQILKTINIRAFKGIKNIQISECARINAFVGKNNSGKSTILHAIEMASIALETNDWNNFHLKLDLKDMFNDLGKFEIALTYIDDSTVSVKSNTEGNVIPTFIPPPNAKQKFKSVLVIPDPGVNLSTRQHKTPRQVLNLVRANNFAYVNAISNLPRSLNISLRSNLR